MGGTRTVALPNEKAESECLTMEQIRNLAQQTMAIERHFKRPVDVEWAIDRKGKVVILQARPLKMFEAQPGSSVSPIIVFRWADHCGD